MKFKKSIAIGVLSLSMLLGLATVSLAEEMSGMNMGGSTQNQSSSQSMQSTQHEATPGMDPNMPGMNMNSSTTPTPTPNDQHMATPGMDPNMPGMNMNSSTTPAPSDPHKATPGMDPNMPGMSSNNEHSESAPEGVNWPVISGFSILNLLVIATAGVLKFKAKTN